jgi:hypothetical protein
MGLASAFEDVGRSVVATDSVDDEHLLVAFSVRSGKISR